MPSALLLRAPATARLTGIAREPYPTRPVDLVGRLPRTVPAATGTRTAYAGTCNRARVPGTRPQNRAHARRAAGRSPRPAPRGQQLPPDDRPVRQPPGARGHAHILPGQAAQTRPVQAV